MTLTGSIKPTSPHLRWRQIFKKRGGKEIHFLTDSFYKIIDGTVGGARMGKIKDVVEEHL